MVSGPVIRTERLTKFYRVGMARRKIEAVVELDLEVGKGEIFAFIGLNGAGKTTTIKLLLDHAKPTAGKAYLFDIDARNSRARSKVGYLPDLPYFYRFLTARELLDYFGRLFGLSRSDRRERTGRLLGLVGLDGRADEPLKGFSRGMLQRLGLAQALINDPALVILDEPLGGLDPIGRVELREVIAGLKKEGRTVFFSSHILDDAQRIADRVGIIHHGRMLACGSLGELLAVDPGWEVELEAPGDIDLEAVCRQHGWRRESRDGRHYIYIPDDEGLREFFKLASDGQIRPQAMGRRRVDLEEAFLAELGRWRG